MENEKLFELMEKFYEEFSDFRKETREEFKEVRADISELRDTATKIEIINETEINPKIQALLDGHVNHSEQLNRIEKEVSRHEEVILRKIR